MKQKYNWQALKLEFFKSDIDEVKGFFKDTYKVWNAQTSKMTTGRSKEKQEHKNQILQKALEKKAEDDAKSLEIPMLELRKAKKAVLGILIKKVSQVIKDNDEINVYEQERILNMIKRELGEPTNITKNDTTLKTEPLDESLFIDD